MDRIVTKVEYKHVLMYVYHLLYTTFILEFSQLYQCIHYFIRRKKSREPIESPKDIVHYKSQMIYSNRNLVDPLKSNQKEKTCSDPYKTILYIPQKLTCSFPSQEPRQAKGLYPMLYNFFTCLIIEANQTLATFLQII